jgi:ribosomal protein L37AE/L43A
LSPEQALGGFRFGRGAAKPPEATLNMPSFVCDTCQETLKKAKLDQHAQRCRQAVFSCIDCYKTFKGTEYRVHTSCITEVEKYHKIKVLPVYW